MSSIAGNLTTNPTIEIVEETGSTNADLAARVSSGEHIAEGHWLCALRQSGGRGRSGRHWISPPGNLYASTILNLRVGDPAPQTLALAIGLAVHHYVTQSVWEGHRKEIALKWPNDVLVRGAKVAGILLERIGDAIVIGIGVNIDFAPRIEGRETTCILDLNSRYDAAPPDALRDGLAPAVAEELARWRRDPSARLIDRWSDCAIAAGTALEVNSGTGAALRGSFAGLDEGGSLRLRLANGEMRTIHAGEVSLIAERNT